MAKKVLIFFPHPLRERHGGPYAYLFHLKEGLKGLSHSISFLSDILPSAAETVNSNQSPSILKKIIKPFLPADWMNKYRAKNWFTELENQKPEVAAEYINQFMVLHFHETIDIWRYKDLLKNYKGKILLTSHTPKPCHLELIEDIWKISANNLNKKIVYQLQQIDSFAFHKADGIFSPCKEATESYYELWSEFSNITRKKQTHYLPTGIKKQIAVKSAEEIRKQFYIPSTAFVFCFTGRKSNVKGFDLLVEAARSLLEKNIAVYFLVIGNNEEAPVINNNRWIETGWTNDPQSFIAASDITVVPNRHTYFDLSVLETLSLGKPLLLSNTGGNKYFKQFHSPGILYHEPDAESLNNEMMNCINQKEKLPDYGLYNENLYEQYFRCERFATEMMNYYNSIQ